MSRRIGIGGIWHESNSLVPVTTGLADFASYQSAAGDDLVDAYADTRTEVGGALAGCARHGFTVVPLAFRAARPSGAVSGEALRFLLDDLNDRIEAAAPLDAVVLCLHGAMVADDDACPDLTVASAVRRSNQGGLLAVTLDFHANLGESLVELADVCVGYRTYPHIDCFETGVEAVDALARIWAAGGTVPPSAFAKLPLLTAPHEQETDDGAMAKVMDMAEALRAERGVDTLNIFPGYPYARSPELGLAVCGSGRSVGLAVSRVADQIWSMRSELAVPLASVEQAVVNCAGTRDGARVVLADVGDNVGGGSAGTAPNCCRRSTTVVGKGCSPCCGLRRRSTRSIPSPVSWLASTWVDRTAAAIPSALR